MARTKKEVPLHKGLPISPFSTVTKWRTWLRRNHASADGIWVKLAKKGSGIRSISYEEARDHAIAFGWIDGLKNAIDEAYYAIRMTRRTKRSKWSQINRDVAERLIESGEMDPAGLAQVEAARADGRWDAAYPSAAKIQMHPDLERALRKNAKARAYFETISGANRFAILHHVHDAKRPETRARRIDKYLQMLERHEVPHPDR